jgi:catechol 2,3-dioxygenase-like lactoylglutathione lyase family enzyme
MLDHITIRVSDLEKSKHFYEKVLNKLGMKIVLGSENEKFWGFGYEDPIFEISQATKENPVHSKVHIAFKAKSRDQIEAVYKTALKAGAKDNGAPGPRPEYTETYYAAFFKDFDDNNIEVCMY